MNVLKNPVACVAPVLLIVACGTTSPQISEPAATGSEKAAATEHAAADHGTAGSAEGATTLNLTEKDMTALFETPVNTLDGEPSSLGAHKGKALLVVNVASKCGLTPQYTELEKLHKDYAGRGFAVVGFPCNQFGGQEPGSAEEIKEFCSLTYGVTFPMFEKVEVNGGGRHPVYQTLTQVNDGEGKAGDIQWNFEKFVISADGKTITRFRPRTTPYDPAIIAAIEAGLPQ